MHLLVTDELSLNLLRKRLDPLLAEQLQHTAMFRGSLMRLKYLDSSLEVRVITVIRLFFPFQ